MAPLGFFNKIPSSAGKHLLKKWQNSYAIISRYPNCWVYFFSMDRREGSEGPRPLLDGPATDSAVIYRCHIAADMSATGPLKPTNHDEKVRKDAAP